MLRGTWDAGAVRLRRASSSGSRARWSSGGIHPAPDIYFGGSSRPGRPGRRQARRRLPDLGRAARSWCARRSSGCGPGRRPGAHPALRAPDPHASPATPARRRGGRPQWLLDGLDPATVAAAQAALSASESTGQQRMLSLRGGRTSYTSARELEVSPDLWAGVGLVRGGAGTALVGSHEEVADRLAEYHRARHRRVHPLGLPARRGGLLVRRGRDAHPARARSPRRVDGPDAPGGRVGVTGVPAPSVCNAGGVDDVTWVAFTLTLTILGGIWTWFAFRSRESSRDCAASGSRSSRSPCC